MSELMKVKVSSSPHIRSEDTTRQIMLDVIIALLPAFAVGVFVFGARAAAVTINCVLTAVIAEYLYQKLMHKPITAFDGSAVVTGMLLAFTMPVSAPLWMGNIGAAFAIVIVKQLFGGIGKNYMNPALAARAFLFSWSGAMTTWTVIRSDLPLFTAVTDAVTSATPLAQLKTALPEAGMMDMARGMLPGCIGETSAVALIAGGLYLLYRRVITLHTPLAFIGTVAVLTYLFPLYETNNLQYMLSHLLSGGLMLGAIFMATDYTTSPVNKTGKVVFGIGCGAITVLIRYFGAYPEGVSYAILVMNAAVFLIEKATRPRVFGHKVKPFEMGGETK